MNNYAVACVGQMFALCVFVDTYSYFCFHKVGSSFGHDYMTKAVVESCCKYFSFQFAFWNLIANSKLLPCFQFTPRLHVTLEELNPSFLSQLQDKIWDRTTIQTLCI